MGTRTDISLKGTLPFRLGTSSYIIPADILPNLAYLQDKIDDAELLLFESDEFSNIPTPEDVQKMADISAEHQLTYTVHLPLDTQLGSADEKNRQSSINKCCRVIDRMLPVNPFGWILHFHGDPGQPWEMPSTDMDRWRNQHARSLEALISHVDDPRRICVETLAYDFTYIADIVQSAPVSVCMDAGHLLLTDKDVFSFWAQWHEKVRVFHLHGVTPEKKDHVDLTYLPNGFLDVFLDMISADDGLRVLTLEIFNEADFLTSIREIEKWRNSHGTHPSGYRRGAER